ncbi:MAG: alpha/beta hydrolase [Bacteroidia bacterium]|nr:alpha/beta hydrolase [Bacteroidia bacterium]
MLYEKPAGHPDKLSTDRGRWPRAYPNTQKKFSQSKIYLAGFSWGSVVGLQLAQQYPEDYEAYVGIAQVINLKKGMKIGQLWLAQQAHAHQDSLSLATLKRIRSNDSTFCKPGLDCFMKQQEILSQYRGAVYNEASEKEVEKALAAAQDYQTYDWESAFVFSAQRLEKDMFATDFSNLKQLDLPVYLLLGRHDWNVPSVLAEDWLKRLQAPHKEVIWFDNSAHNLLEEEPKKFNKVMLEDVLHSARDTSNLQS